MSRKRSAPTSGIETIELSDWSEFYSLIASDFADSPAYVFRGQADADWKVESSLDRWERLHSGTKNSYTKTGSSSARPPVSRDVHLRAFRQATRAIAPVELQKDDEALAWSLAQHHGLRTPLLDWSLSPFVALYFAFEDEYLIDPDAGEQPRLAQPKQRAVFALSTSAIARECPQRGEKQNAIPRVYSPSGPVSQRLLAQSSLFLMMPEKTDLESWIAQNLASKSHGKTSNNQPAVLKKICLPSAGRRECLKMLNKMNINRLTLFPDLDGAARYINDLWSLDFDSALGYFEDADYAE